MKSLHLTLILLFLLVFSANAQNYKLSENPDEFANDVAVMMNGTKVPSSMKAGEDFVNAWNSGKIESADKQKLINITKVMLKKKYRAKPHYEGLFNMVTSAAVTKSLPSPELSKVINVTQKVVDTYDSQALLGYFETCKNLFESEALFVSNYNSLIIKNGSYTFDYVTPGSQLAQAEEPAPAPVTETQSSDPFDPFFSDWDTEPAPAFDEALEQPTMVSLNAAEIPEVNIPAIEGAVITFTNVDLVLATRFDTTQLVGTSGSFLFSDNQFVGEGGKFDWSVADMPEVYVKFNKYAFAVKNPVIVSDKVSLYYPDKIDTPVEGIFNFTSKSHKTADDAQYPRFKSYSDDIKVKNLGENIDYKGGFALAGRHIYSSSINGGNATIKIQHQGKSPFKAISKRFEFNDSLITSDVTYAAIYMDQDSIYHHGVRLLYNKDIRELKLYKDKGGYKNSSFIDSYHQIEMDCDAVSWALDSSKIEFYIINARHQVPATFESKEYYNDGRFERLQGLYNFHPVIMLASYAAKAQSQTFSLYDLAEAYKQNPDQLKSLMANMMNDGFIEYNELTGMIKLREKTSHYFLSQRNKKDFDFMSIKSISAAHTNAVLDLNTQELLINGVERFYLSDSLGVYIEPNNKVLRMLDNRNFIFDGKINAGKFLTFGQRFKFDYSNFKVDLDQIDSIIVNLDIVKKGSKQNIETATRSKLENRTKNTSGVLYINDPKNKSGKKPFPQYPVFDVSSAAYIYFDSKEVLNKAYDQRVFFTIPPFKVDSMASNSPSAVVFDGSFNSDDIFPEFEGQLTIQPDKTFGFTHQVPAEGYQLYKGAGKFYGMLSMNGKGLRGKGEIKYLTTTIVSDDFLFYQDSVIASGKSVIVKEGKYENINMPDAVVNNYKMKWYPKEDSLLIYNKPKEPIQLYNNSATLEGRLNLTSRGILGDGLIKTRGVQIYTKHFNFETDRFSGNYADFEVKPDNALKPALLSRNVKFNFNLAGGYADFAPEVEGFASVEFPYAQYKTSISKAVWDINKKVVTMSTPKEADISSSYFYSTHPDQDSLVFNARDAVYDMEKLSLNISGIPYIKSADAKIIPEGNKVTILEKAKMQPLTNAVIIVDTINGYHRLTNGNIKIKSRKEYLGDALYQYAMAEGDTFAIRFDNFTFTTEEARRKNEAPIMHTVSGGTIDESKPLEISPGVLYKGNVTMHATKKTLDFDGEVKLDVKNEKLASGWLRYENKSDNPEFVLNMKEARTKEGIPLVSGIHVETGSGKMYYTFVSEKKIDTDKDVFIADGQLSYNKESRMFRLGNPDKIKGKSYEGNIFSYNDSLSTISYEGKLNFATSDNNVSFTSSGSGTSRLDTNTYSFNVLMAMDLGLPAQAMEAMGKVLTERITAIGNVTEANDDKVSLLYKIADIAGNKVAEDYDKMSQTEYVSLSRMSPVFARGIVLSDVNLKWSDKHNAWYSVGRLGLANVNKHDQNAKVDGFVEIKKTYGGEVVTVYIEASPETWYFFTYDDQKRLSALSSEADFNQVVAGKSRSNKARPGEYFFTLADMMERAVAIKSFHKMYFDQDVVPTAVQAQTDTPEGEQAKVKGGKNRNKGKGKDLPEDIAGAKPDEPKKEQPKQEPKKTADEEDADGF
jgi:hypothetical protein